MLIRTKIGIFSTRCKKNKKYFAESLQMQKRSTYFVITNDYKTTKKNDMKYNELLSQSNEIAETNTPFILALEKFVKFVNSQPDPADIKNRQGYNYLPISAIETELDRCFAGLWQTKNMQWKLIANEVVVSIELEVFNPIAKVWLTRSGIGAAQMRMSKGAEITDITKKLKNALEMDVAHAKADAIKNAAKSLGNLFGRNLTRKASDTKDYKTILLDKVSKLANNEKAAQSSSK